MLLPPRRKSKATLTRRKTFINSRVHWAMMLTSFNTCPLFNTPLEIRHQIIGEILFPGETQPKDLTQNNRGTASTAVRQIHPYDTDEDKKPRIDVAIIRTCSQLQHEAEAVLYGSSSWNLMYQDWWDRDKVSYDFFERLPRRLRRLIQRVERKCYSEPYWNTISLYDWKLFMTFLAQECPNLHSLRLWGPGDRQEGPPWVETCGKDQEWVQAVLQIKSLEYFDIPVIPGGIIYEYPKFREDFLPWLKFNMVGGRKAPNAEDTVTLNGQTGLFPFLQLERNIRDLIYRHTLLPADKRVHPYIKSWHDLTTRAAVPVFLTCKQMHDEAEAILYGQGIFTSPPLQKYEKRLCRWLGGRLRDPGTGLNPRLLALIRHLSFGWHKVGQHRFFSIITRSMQLEHLELILSANDVEYINTEWLHRARNPKALWRAGYAGDFAMVSKPLCRYKWVLLCFFHKSALRKGILFKSAHNVQDLPLGDSVARLSTNMSTLRRHGTDTDSTATLVAEIMGYVTPWMASVAKESHADFEIMQQTYSRIPKLTIRTPHGSQLDPDCLEWWTSGLRQEFLYPSGDPKLAWLHTDLKGISTRYSAASMQDGVPSPQGYEDDRDVYD